MKAAKSEIMKSEKIKAAKSKVIKSEKMKVAKAEIMKSEKMKVAKTKVISSEKIKVAKENYKITKMNEAAELYKSLGSSIYPYELIEAAPGNTPRGATPEFPNTFR